MAAGSLAVAAAVSCLLASGDIGERMDAYVRSGRVAGVLALIADAGGTEHTSMSGYRDRDARAPIQRDTLFQIMSMTKPVTAVAVMVLVEERRLGLDDPVARYIPEFARRSDAGRTITIRQLLTHTSGLPPEDPKPIWDEAVKRSRTVADVARLVAREPLASTPGTRSLYSGPGFAVLGRVVEVASGMPFERFLAQRIFAPLRMDDTFFFPPASVRSRIAKVYEFRDGRLSEADVDRYREGARYANPAGGLFSTAHDVARFLRMMLNGGALEGARILSRDGVAAMSTRQSVAQPSGTCAPAFGLGWQVPSQDQGCKDRLGPGAYGHSGSFGTYMWVDPVRRLACVFLIQRIGGGHEERDAFMSLVEREWDRPGGR